MAVRIQMRRDTQANWASNDPTLADGEMGFEKDTNRWKIGNGTQTWTALPYANSIFSGSSIITDNSAGDALRITQLGAGNALLVEDSTNPDATPFVVTGVGRVGIATTTPSYELDVIGTVRGNQIISSVSNGTAPIVVTSQTVVTNLNADLLDGQHGSYYAPVSSPELTGSPMATTASVDTNSTRIATTAFVIGQASSTNPAMNGSVAIGTSTRYARADHVHPVDTSRAPLASPEFTGTPTSTTASVDTNNTQIATTAFVIGQGYLKSSTASSTYATINSVITVTTNTQTSSYAIALSDVGKIIEMDSPSPNTVTIPNDSSVNFPVGSTVDIIQIGSGQTTIVADTEVTIYSSGSALNLATQYAAASLYKKDANTWIAMGNLS